MTGRSKVVDVLANPDGSIQVTVRFDKEDATYQWTSIHEGRVGLRTIESRNIGTGAYAIRGGKIVSSGRRALLQTHCE
ncbi:MAG: hypothetical protein D6773_12380 [Alphaproteobacteria bacterium]|nr:MAG: hypothetical protein D6773_12380 [Alphaproteobacteria bacterium]